MALAGFRTSCCRGRRVLELQRPGRGDAARRGRCRCRFLSALIYQYVSGGTLITADATTDPILAGVRFDANGRRACLMRRLTTTPAGGPAGVQFSRWLLVNLPAPITDFAPPQPVTTSAITLAVRNQHPPAPDAAFNDCDAARTDPKFPFRSALCRVSAAACISPARKRSCRIAR